MAESENITIFYDNSNAEIIRFGERSKAMLSAS